MPVSAISYLQDDDHQLGQAYFLGAESWDKLKETLVERVFPLLQEYFFDDPKALRQVLGSRLVVPWSLDPNQIFEENPGRRSRPSFRLVAKDAIEPDMVQAIYR